jgi:ABC-2 type transport system ATP-binding protein
MIEIKGLSKAFAEKKAVQDATFEVREGEVFGLIGPDGAGKSTLFRMLSTLLLPDSGSARIMGMDLVKDYRTLRTCIGYMPGKFSLYQDLSVAENLSFFAAVFGTNISQNYALIEPIYKQIKPFEDRRAGALSGGMKQKLALCCALIHRPKILFLDEPGTGVDPVSRKEFWDMLAGLRQFGITMLVSTPNMDEAALCDRIALMQHGKILAIDRPISIQNGFSSPLYALRADNMYHLIQDIRQLEGVADCYAFGEYAHVKLEKNHAKPLDERAILSYLQEKSHQGISCFPTVASIEDCFIELMKSN